VTVVSRGGRPDLALDLLPAVQAPTLLIVGGDDAMVLDLNRRVLPHLPPDSALEVVAHETHLFAEPGAMEQVVHSAVNWFERFLVGPQRS
jgi:pimeloyl-ACP methyl ester carboxylesterase